MFTLERLIFFGGVLHFGILIASALVPFVLKWRTTLQRVDPLSRQLIWTHGAFIVLVIIGFGLISMLYPAELASGTPLARAVVGLIATFWGTRIFLQAFVLDSRAYLTNFTLKAGHHLLTTVFAYHTVVYTLAVVQS